MVEPIPLEPQSPTPPPKPAAGATALLELARDTTPAARERLLLGVVSLCDSHRPGMELSPVLADIFLILARQAERDIRKTLSNRLAEADWAPRALINILALDEIEIARPVLTASPVLQDEDLLRVLLEATLEHQIAVARRPNLTSRVADAIIDKGEPATLTALASNPSAAITSQGVTRLVEHSRRIAALRSPLSRHPALTEDLAVQMYQWVGAALRQAIDARFQVPAHKLAPVLEAAVREASGRPHLNVVPAALDDEADQRLIAKLEQAGQLRAGYLIRAVRERRLGLFAHGLAALSRESTEDIRRALNAETPEALFYACAAVGIDRAVFPALLTEIRLLNQRRPGDGGDRVWRREPLSTTAYGQKFRAALEAAAH